ncbi:hypothetical protein XENOCAPTIV_015270 [Xenoophorus captivus]|uniref:Uncharacterized protein n=2 Tax=Goodeidae TaxID=28758 RepID=A0ABV0S1N8_9TELE
MEHAHQAVWFSQKREEQNILDNLEFMFSWSYKMIHSMDTVSVCEHFSMLTSAVIKSSPCGFRQPIIAALLWTWQRPGTPSRTSESQSSPGRETADHSYVSVCCHGPETAQIQR